MHSIGLSPFMRPRCNQRQPQRATVRSLRLLAMLGLAVIIAPFVLQAAPPQWWYDRGVVDPTQTPNDYAAVNQGQVKFIAEQAAAEMEAHLPGGIADPDGQIQTLLNTWGAPTALTNDFTAVNLGQLKALATPFYDQLIRVGYVNNYPWAGHESLANNYAAANIGQVKNLFSFDLTSTDAAHDINGDGLPDWWENYYHVPSGIHATDILPWGTLTYLQGFQRGLNPVDFYDGQSPSFVGSSGDGQHGAPSEFVPLPLTVSVASNGQPLANAPIKFVVTKGAGQVQRSSNSTPGQSIMVLTDDAGNAKVFFKLSSAASDQNQVTAIPGSGTYPVNQVFTAIADVAAGTNDSPFNPSNVVATMNRDGSADVSWTDNADPTDLEPIDIMYKNRSGAWQVLTNVPAGTTSYHIPAP